MHLLPSRAMKRVVIRMSPGMVVDLDALRKGAHAVTLTKTRSRAAATRMLLEVGLVAIAAYVGPEPVLCLGRQGRAPMRRIVLRLPHDLVARLDKESALRRAHQPGEKLSRADLVRALLGFGLAGLSAKTANGPGELKARLDPQPHGAEP